MTEFEHYLSISAVDTNQDTSELIGWLWLRQKASKHKIEFDFSCRQRGCRRSSMTSLIESIHRVSFEAVCDWHSASLLEFAKTEGEHWTFFGVSSSSSLPWSSFRFLEDRSLKYNFSFLTSPKRQQTQDNVDSVLRVKLALRKSLNLHMIAPKNAESWNMVMSILSQNSTFICCHKIFSAFLLSPFNLNQTCGECIKMTFTFYDMAVASVWKPRAREKGRKMEKREKIE